MDHALCRSALWEALALGFRTPTDETIAQLGAAEGARALADAAAALGDGDADDLAAGALALGEEAAPALADLEAAYDRLFGHTARGLIPPYETEYGEDSPFLPQREMSDLAAFYRAFGLALRRDAHERADHIACECEFMLVLARKEAWALEAGDAAMLETTRHAARAFLRDHLGRWAPAFGLRLAREGSAGFYARLGRLAAAFVAAECRRVEVTAGPELLRLRSADPPDAPMACATLPDGQ
ncbi:MAG: molecular chaperone TorD family protein [Candidatus Rokubacteria bacterium]|nr:molecular chaperone TorD family protein [Candidatus Rokubacteria bacterium]